MWRTNYLGRNRANELRPVPTSSTLADSTGNRSQFSHGACPIEMKESVLGDADWLTNTPFVYPIKLENLSSRITFSMFSMISVKSGNWKSSVTGSISFLYNFNMNSMALMVLANEFAIVSVVDLLVAVVLLLSQLSASDIMRCSRRCIKANDKLKSPICKKIERKSGITIWSTASSKQSIYIQICSVAIALWCIFPACCKMMRSEWGCAAKSSPNWQNSLFPCCRWSIAAIASNDPKMKNKKSVAFRHFRRARRESLYLDCYFHVVCRWWACRCLDYILHICDGCGKCDWCQWLQCLV